MKQNKDSGENKVSSRDIYWRENKNRVVFVYLILNTLIEIIIDLILLKMHFCFTTFFLIIIKPFRPAVPGAH